MVDVWNIKLNLVYWYTCRHRNKKKATEKPLEFFSLLALHDLFHSQTPKKLPHRVFLAWSDTQSAG
jgi:hypothetical protein